MRLHGKTGNGLRGGAKAGSVEIGRSEKTKQKNRDYRMGEFDWLEEAAEKIRDKEYEVAKRNKGKIPHSAEHGIFDDCSGTEKIGTRTNGFYGGIQWQLYNATREPLFLENALSIEKKLDAVLMDSQAMDDSSGILFMPTAVADFHMTGSRPARNRALLAANNLAGRFNPNGNFIRAFNDPDAGENTRPKENCAGTSHVRTLMSLPLLYWASEVTKDPRFRAIAVKHGLMAARHFIQKDGSVRSIVRFDPETGEWIDPNENEDAVDHGCGKADYDASEHAGLTKKTVGNCACISRQQAVALYGFTISFFHTGEADFLKAAEKTAAFLLSCVPGDDQNPGQFAHDHAGAADDASTADDAASVIAASGLILLAGLVGNDQSLLPPVAAALSAGYRTSALQLIQTYTEKRVCFDAERDELLDHCMSEGNRKKASSLIYADYFYIEAIWRLTGRELLIW